MRLRPVPIALSLCALLSVGAAQALAARPKARPAAVAKAAKPATPPLSFDKDVRPVLKAYCFDCHGGEALQAKLDLRLRRFLAKGGASGPAIVAHKPGESLLLKRIKSGSMPPVGKKVPPEQIAIVERWIAQGAPASRVEPAQLPLGMDITPEERAYWFFQPLRLVDGDLRAVHSGREKPRRHQRQPLVRRQLVAGQLPLHEPVVRHSLVEGLDHEVPVVIGRWPIVVVLKPVALGEPRQVQPVPPPPLPVRGRGQQPVQ
jgi:mono/diheme cytochrome c family protein